jgi:hypothetical protein
MESKKTKETEKIKIWWEGPFGIDEILEGKIDTKYENTVSSIGLYQIYGHHPLYGNDVLLYIGRTKNKNGFKSRLKNRLEIEGGNDAENIRIYLGCIFSDEVKINIQEEMKKIEKAEVLLINSLKPALNSANVKGVGNQYSKDKFIVFNEGNYRDLYPIVSSEYFWGKYKNYIVLQELAKYYKKAIDESSDDEEFWEGVWIVDDKIWVGIDYSIWNTEGMPLIIEILDENKSLEEKLKEIDDATVQHIDDGAINYTLPAIENLNDLMEEIVHKIDERIESIKALLE